MVPAFLPAFSNAIHNFPRYAQRIHNFTPTSPLLATFTCCILLSTQRLNYRSVVLPGNGGAKAKQDPVV
jgi:hypothetical protein